MDITDAKILELLQENARISISEISKRVNMSLSAVSERLKKLETSGLIEKYTTLINPHYLGQELMVIMNLCLEEEQKLNFREFVKGERAILECHYITGEYDINLKIVTKNTVTLERLINKVKSFPGVGRSQTNVVLSSFKNNCSIGPIVD